MIPYGKQSVDQEDIKSVAKVLKSDFLTTGPKIQEFEKKFSKYVGSKYAVAVSSGTAALHLACLASGLKEKDELITSPLTFAASANCALYCGAKPIFVDINNQGVIDENKIEQKVTKKTKIIIPIHYSGLPCNLAYIKKIAQKDKLIIIEDASHALGARYKNSKIGDVQYSNMAVFSLHPIKHITTGEGGVITTNTKKFYEKLIMLRNHGITKDNSKFKLKSSKFAEPWYYEMQELGFNYRLTDLQCALGISQLKKIGKFIKCRREIAKKYNQVFNNLKHIEIIKENKDQFNAYHLYPIRVENEKIRLKLFKFLQKNGVLCQVHYIPVYWHPFYKKLGYQKGLCPIAENFYQREISLPIYPSLKIKSADYVIKKILKFFGK